MKALARVKEIAQQHQLPMAILLIVVVALIMTVVSLSLYVSSGTLQLDLSRPGYESARKELTKPEDKSETDYATNGPVNKQALDEYQKLFEAQRSELNRIGKFKDQGLSDETLMLSGEAVQN